ncbi:hypothetical protein Salat_2511300 [Sesamum alatum]|uniref:Uncharacterized protein n=1 Tax=Sesamum alatum TaxID=300844 RepID=A0AAE1XRS7_9LAMI|nr:hypothetical protein Salat_2511300 [Sesamum alatum]
MRPREPSITPNTDLQTRRNLPPYAYMNWGKGDIVEEKGEFRGFRALAMKDYEIEEKKQAAADVLFQYSKFALACLGNQARPCDLRLHLMKEISGLPTSLKKASPQATASPDVMGESSSSGTARLDKADSFRAL